MKIYKSCLSLLAVAAIGILSGCSSTTKSADVSGGIRTSLDKAGLKGVSVTQDHDKGVVTLGGHVAADAEKSQAESIATSVAGAQVVSNQIEVLPPGAEHDSKRIDSDLDKGIAGNLDAALIQGGLHKDINYAVKNQVVTMTGEVDSQSKRTQAQDIVAAVPNVLQVVNELQVKEQKATSSN
jgi:osmotically-inducible protein OsmY